MDPDAAINIILRGTESGDFGRVAEACEDLRQWLAQGGFTPTVNSTMLRKLLQLARIGATHLDGIEPPPEV